MSVFEFDSPLGVDLLDLNARPVATTASTNVAGAQRGVRRGRTREKSLPGPALDGPPVEGWFATED